MIFYFLDYKMNKRKYGINTSLDLIIDVIDLIIKLNLLMRTSKSILRNS